MLRAKAKAMNFILIIGWVFGLLTGGAIIQLVEPHTWMTYLYFSIGVLIGGGGLVLLARVRL